MRWLDGITNSTDVSLSELQEMDVSLSELQEMGINREAWCAAIYGFA